MSFDRTYCTAADLARTLGYDRTTVLDWIKSGKITAKKQTKSGAHRKIFLKYFKESYVREHKKKDFRYKTWWTPAELYILQSNIEMPLTYLVKMIPHRTKTAIKLKRKRIRRALRK